MTTNEPVILALEASGDLGGAAILRGRELLAEELISARRAHGQFLVPAIKTVLQTSGLDASQLDMIAVNHGPGSYTGLRVGLAAAETLAFVHGLPAVGIGAMEAMCEEVVRQELITQTPCTLLPCLDARRDELIAAAFTFDGNTLTRTSKDTLLAPNMLHTLAGETPTVCFGDAADIYADAISVEKLTGAVDIHPSSVGLAALRQLEKGLIQPKEGQRVSLQYFRPILAQTIKERQEKAAARGS